MTKHIYRIIYTPSNEIAVSQWSTVFILVDIFKANFKTVRAVFLDIEVCVDILIFSGISGKLSQKQFLG